MQSTPSDPAKLIKLLRQNDVVLAEGLTNAEVSRVESIFTFRFPPDLRELLQYALPVSPRFPDWRNESGTSLKDRLDWPADGICFDIENNDFWWEEWGPKPLDTPSALNVARQAIAKAPVLIPIYSHRYIPSEPSLSGNPIFSVYQTDIIYYGKDIPNYFANEFSPKGEHHSLKYADVQSFRFWSQLVESW